MSKKKTRSISLITNYLVLNKKTGIGLLILFFISRIIFINAKEVFFDSKEYLDLFANPSFYKAIVSGHPPIHEGYIILFWPVYHLGQLLHFDPGYTVVIGEILLSVLTIYCYYKCIAFISDTYIALFSSIIISLAPVFWITHVTISVEGSYLSFYFLSLYLLTRYLSNNKLSILLLSFLCYGVSFITYSAVLLWLPVYFSFVFYKKREIFIKIFVGMGLFLFVTLVVRLLILAKIFNSTPLTMLHTFYLSNVSDAGTIQNNVTGLLIRIRDFIPVLRSYTSLVFILSMVSLIYSFVKNKKIFVIGFLWIIPVLYTNQWWDALLMGRYSIIAGFGIAFLTAYFISKYRFLAPILIIYMLVTTLPALSLLRFDTPYMQVEHYAKTLPKNGLLIESHYEQPILEHCCSIMVLGVNRPDVGNPKIEETINTYLKNKKPVFVTSAALSDPYGLYEGPYLHPLSLSYAHNFQLDPMLTSYTWKVYKVINVKDNLIIYQIISHGKSTYPPVLNMQRSYRRVDYYDPVTRLWWILQDSVSPGNKKQ